MTKLKLVLAGALATTLATTAMAEECSHSGFYAGGQVGLGMMKSHIKITAPAEDAVSTKLASTGIIGGIHVGYGKQTNRFYMGVEASGNLSNTKSSHGDDEDRTKVKREHNYGVALRPGVVFGNALVYTKLGIDSSKFKFRDSSNEVKISKRRLGFVPGLGVSFPVNRHIVLGVESTYSMYRKIKNKNAAGATVGSIKNSVLDTVVRASYKW